MLCRLSVKGYKSLTETEIDFAQVTFLLGLLGAGKSNILRSIMALRDVSGRQTVGEALASSNEGDLKDAFSLQGRKLAKKQELTLGGDVSIRGGELLRYRVSVSLDAVTQKVAVTDEYLCALSRQQEPKGVPRIEREKSRIKIRRRVQQSPPYLEDVGLLHALLGDPRLSGKNYPELESLRAELAGWRFYRLGGLASRQNPTRYQEVEDIGYGGEQLLPFLRRIQMERPGLFRELQMWLGKVIQGVQSFDVHLDEQYGALHLQFKVNGQDFVADGLPEGLLRTLALLAAMINPWGSRMIALDEPENGLDPRSTDRLGEALLQLALEQDLQVVVGTHSPWLCERVFAQSEDCPESLSLLNVQQGDDGTIVMPFEGTGPLFAAQRLAEALEPEN